MLGVVTYNSEYYETRDKSLALREEIDNIISLLNPQPLDRILEVGCGGGTLLKSLERYGSSVIGVDCSLEAVCLAKARVRNIEVVCGDAARLPCDDESIDKLISQHCIEHFRDGLLFLREQRRVLKRGGVMVIVTPNACYPDTSLFYDPTHARLYSMPELKEITESCGLSVEKIYSTSPAFMIHHRRIFLATRFLWRVILALPGLSRQGSSIVMKARKV